MDDFVLVAVPYAVEYTMVQVPFEYHLSGFVQGGFGGANLYENILAGLILFYHFDNAADLTFDSLQPCGDGFDIHALFHMPSKQIGYTPMGYTL